jgi:hypothetical protein
MQPSIPPLPFIDMRIFVASMLLIGLFTNKSWGDSIPINWEQHPELVSLSLDLSKDHLKIQIKNTSPSKERIGIMVEDSLVVAFYVNDNGGLVSIGEHPDFLPRSGPIAEDLDSGQEFTRTLELSPSELSEITTHPVVCRMFIYGPAAKKMYYIEFPKQMVRAAN